MNRRMIGSMAASAMAAAVLAPGASAAGLQFKFSFGSRTTGVPSTGHVDVVFPTDAQGSPKQLAGLDFQFPQGTAIDRSVAPACIASDDQINANGVDACPADTQVGWGTSHAHTGFGAPVDPFPSDAHTFNTPTGTVNIFTPTGLRNPTVYRTRQRYDGLWVRDSFPAPPAGFPPPDGKSLPLDAQFTLDRRAAGRSWLTTPPTCPTQGAWTANVIITYTSGSHDTASTTTPCDGTATQTATNTDGRAAPHPHARVRPHGRRCRPRAPHNSARCPGRRGRK